MEESVCPSCGEKIKLNMATPSCVACKKILVSEQLNAVEAIDIEGEEWKTLKSIVRFSALETEEIALNVGFLKGDASKISSFVEKAEECLDLEEDLFESSMIDEAKRDELEEYLQAYDMMVEAYSLLTFYEANHIDKEMLNKYEISKERSKKAKERLAFVKEQENAYQKKQEKKSAIMTICVQSLITVAFALALVPFLFIDQAAFMSALAILCAGHSCVFFGKKEVFDAGSFNAKALDSKFIQRLVLQALLLVETIIAMTALKMGKVWFLVFAILLILIVPNAYGFLIGTLKSIRKPYLARLSFLLTVVIFALLGYVLFHNLNSLLMSSMWNILWLPPLISFGSVFLGIQPLRLFVPKLKEEEANLVLGSIGLGNIAYMVFVMIYSIVRLFAYEKMNFWMVLFLLLYVIIQVGVGFGAFVCIGMLGEKFGGK